MIALFAEAPALLHTAGPYVAAAYIVFLLIVLIYVWLMARRLISNSRELRDLRRRLDDRLPDLEHGVPRSIANQTDNDSDSHYQIELDEDGAPTGGAGLQ